MSLIDMKYYLIIVLKGSEAMFPYVLVHEILK